MSECTEECTENIDQVKITRMDLFEHENECVYSCTIFVVLTVIVLIISIGIRCLFCLISLVLKNVTRDKELGIKKNFNYQATIY